VSEPLSVVGYVRVSTEEQSRDGVSLEAQTEKVRAYCQLYGLRLICVLCDPGESAKKLDRPGLNEALAMLDDGRAGGLVIAKLDRLTRSVVDFGALLKRYFDERAGKQLLSVADSIDSRTAAGRLVLNVLMSVAQWELEVIRERTRDALDLKRSKGERIGTIPYGWGIAADGITLFRDPVEQHWVETMKAWRQLGKSYRAIAGMLEDAGVPTRCGRPWSHSSVSTILTRRGRG